METIERDERAPLAFDDEPLELMTREGPTTPRRVQEDLDLFAKEDDLLAELELEEAAPPAPTGRLGLIFAIGVVLIVATLGGRAALEASAPAPVAGSIAAQSGNGDHIKVITSETSVVRYELERARASQ